MIEINKVYNEDCLEGMKRIGDCSVDLIVTDPPYILSRGGAGGAFGKGNRNYYDKLTEMDEGITDEYLDQMVRICKKPNIYLFCSKDQVKQYLCYAVNNNLSFDILTWHKTNPIPTCNNKYLPDTEYLIYLRRGAKLYGNYSTKKKYFITDVNKKDLDEWSHPTIKPLSIIRTLIFNSSVEGDIVCDPFMGSGTTAIAAIREHRNYIGFELNAEYWKKSNDRIKQELSQLTLF